MRDSPDRLQELLLDRALWGLSRAEERELRSARDLAWVGEELRRWDRAASSATVAMLSGVEETPPATLLSRLQDDAIGFLSRQRGARTGPGWRAFAAVVLAAVSVFWWISLASPEMAPPRQETALLLQTPGVFHSEWQPGPSPLSGSVRGEMVWSDREQEGYMVFMGLPANDPEENQYQLWIFDATRSGDYPVDGGVFDIPPASFQVRIPVDAKLGIRQATMFAVTVERPGGVVVSDREHIVAVAGS